MGGKLRWPEKRKKKDRFIKKDVVIEQMTRKSNKLSLTLFVIGLLLLLIPHIGSLLDVAIFQLLHLYIVSHPISMIISAVLLTFAYFMKR